MLPRLPLHFSLFIFLLAACAPATAVPTPLPTSTSTHLPTSTSTHLPTSTPTHLPTYTPLPSPTSTSTPLPLNPLTGLPVSDPAVLNRRPIAIKVAHFPRRVREHQVGLYSADNVWEHYAEGGVTRFTAIYLSQSPDRVGNVRSARLIDTYLGVAYSAMLVASGSSQGTLQRLDKAGFYDRVIAEATGYFGCPLLCREESADLTADKLYTAPAAVWQLADELKLNGPQNLVGFVFAQQPPAGGETVGLIHLDFQQNNTITEWRYFEDGGVYSRWIDTAASTGGSETRPDPTLDAQIDMSLGEQLYAENVVVMYLTHTVSAVKESEKGEVYGYDIHLTGSGPALIFRNGKMYSATWTRATGGLPRFTAPDGSPLPFKPGNIWFEVLSTDSPSAFENETFTARFKAPKP